MFSNAPVNSRHATDGSGGGADGAAADDAAARVIKVIADKRALQVRAGVISRGFRRVECLVICRANPATVMWLRAQLNQDL
jgi:hypothetical protein